MKSQLFKATVDYDGEFDQLTVRRPDYRTSFSLEAGNVILEFTSKEFIGLEIQDAKQWLLDLFGAKIDPRQIIRARIGLMEKKSFVVIFLELVLPGNQLMSKEVTVQKFNPVPIMAHAV